MTQEIGPGAAPEVVKDCSNWAESFCPFTIQHVVVVSVCALITVAVIALGRRWREGDHERLLRRTLGAGVIATQGASEIYWMFITPFNKAEAFPLHLCDVAIWTVVIAMLTDKRWARAVVYFMGLALSTQGFFTPTLQYGYESPRFWFFWIGHTQIVGSALYFVFVCRFYPTWRDFKAAAVVTIGWLILVFTINLIFDVNYGYVGRTDPSNPTIVQELGPWPWRVLIMCAMAFVAYVAVWMLGAGLGKFDGTQKIHRGDAEHAESEQD